MAVAALGLASCSEEETVSRNHESDITFRAAVNLGGTSRGLDTSTDNLMKFYVTAVEPERHENLFTHLLFKWNEEKEAFVSDTVYQWSKNLELDFYAYGYYTGNKMTHPTADNNVFGEVTLDTDQQTFNNFSPQREIADQVDIVTATAHSGQTALNASVQLTFDHILSEVQVVARCSNPAHTVLVKAMSLGNITSVGNYQFGSPNNPGSGAGQWTVGAEKTSYTIKLPEPVDLSTVTFDHNCKDTKEPSYYDLNRLSTNGYALLIPQGLSTFNSDNQYWSVDEEGNNPADKTLASAQYIALLIQVWGMENGEKSALKYPVTTAHQADTDGYGWAYIPIHTDKVPDWKMGYRYIYHLDFSKGAGYNPDGDPILNGDIQFTATVNPWSVVDIFKPGDKVIDDNDKK